MTSAQALLRIKNGLNKLDSQDYPNIKTWKIEEAVNTATTRVCRRKLQVRETTTTLVDDMQLLLKSSKLAGSNKDTYFLSHKLPADYFAHSKVTPLCNKGMCTGIRIKSDLVEDSNVSSLLEDFSSQPSFELEQTFHVLAGNKVKQYHNGDFTISELEVDYYRAPQYITFEGTPQVTGGVGKDMTWEFKDDICDIIIEEAIGILAYNTESMNRGSISDRNVQQSK